MKAKLRIRQGNEIREEVVNLKVENPYRMMRAAEAFMQERNQGVAVDDRAVLLSVKQLSG